MSRRPTRIADREAYRGYDIELESFDWDAQFLIYKDGQLVKRCYLREDAKKWIDYKIDGKVAQ